MIVTVFWRSTAYLDHHLDYDKLIVIFYLTFIKTIIWCGVYTSIWLYFLYCFEEIEVWSCIVYHSSTMKLSKSQGREKYNYSIKSTHICITTISSDNGLSPGRRQVIIWNNAVDVLTMQGRRQPWYWPSLPGKFEPRIEKFNEYSNLA